MLLVLGARELLDKCMLSFLLNLAEQLDGFIFDRMLIVYLVLAALTELGVHDLVSFQTAATVCNFGSTHGNFETFEVCDNAISRQRLLGSSTIWFWFWFWIWACVCVWILISFLFFLDLKMDICNWQQNLLVSYTLSLEEKFCLEACSYKAMLLYWVMKVLN